MSFSRISIISCRACLVLCGALVLQSGCATTQFVKVREKPHNPLAERLKTSTLGHFRPSDRTERFLRNTGYRGREDLNELLRHTSAETAIQPTHESLHAQAELNYLGAQAMCGKDVQLASELYLDAAHAAWHYFATPDSSSTLPSPTDPSHRDAAEIYNAGCEALLRIARQKGNYQLGRSVVMPISGRRLLFEIPFENRHLSHDQLGEFEFVTDYKLQNLRNHHAADGLGVPIIAVRKSATVPQPIEEYYTQGMSIAATIVLRFPDGVPPSAASRGIPVRLQILDPRESDGIVVGETLMPLETDFSTPLAKFLSNPDLRLLDTWGFFRPDRARSVAGLYMVQPYDPDRIPVVMVHGIWSSPMTWMEMFNDLQADPEIRRHYQFWFYLYPTGEPLAFATANLRDELEKVRNDCDPQRTNPRLDNMVMVGHSMGGLISHMLTIDSADRLWNSVSNLPFEQIPADAEQKQEIKRVFYFESNPSINRIVTIASPYGGSRYSNAFTRWLSGSLIWLPSRTLQLSRVVFEQADKGWWDRMSFNKTSLDSLTKKSAILTLIRNTNVPEDVRHHNVVGVGSGRSPEDWTDGVVSFRSAHRDDVESEVMVPARHSDIQRHPQTIAEVRRILVEHLQDARERRFPVIPVRHHDETPTSATSRALSP